MPSSYTLLNAPLRSPFRGGPVHSPNNLFLDDSWREGRVRSNASPLSPSLHFREISPLSTITLRRGRAQRRVKPYSVDHAFLTGHSGTPTRRGSLGNVLGGVAATLIGTGDLETSWEEPEDLIVTPTFKPLVRLGWAPADLPETKCESEVDFTGAGEGAEGRDNIPDLIEQGDHLDPNTDISGAGDAVDPAYTPSRWWEYVTVPAELLHHPDRSPYFLRTNRAHVAERIEEQASIVGLPLDAMFLKEAKIKKFTPEPTDRQLETLFKCVALMAIGVSLSEFGKIMRECDGCERYIFVDGVRRHTCKDEPYDPTAEEFSVLTAIYHDRCPGMDAEDIEKVFVVCDTCRRVYLERFLCMHNCTDLGDAEDSSEYDGQ